MSSELTKANDDGDFFESVRGILAEARGKAAASVNFIMVEAYWRIGRRNVEEEQGGAAKAAYGDALLPELSRELTAEFGRGFSHANLRNFRQFYLTWPDWKICYALCSELSWSHNRLIMREERKEARIWYLRESKEQNWSVRQLDRQLRTRTIDRVIETNAETDSSESSLNPLAILKDPYVLEFLGLPEDGRLHEEDFESKLIGSLEQFLLELGKGFSFIGRQFRISSETSHFYIDLVFYNYLLKCFVLFDLKTAKLTHQDIGQMDMYVRMFDDLKRGEDDNPTLGVILCADKDETVVKYSVLKESEQLFASKYLRVLPTEEEFARQLDEAHVLEISKSKGEAE
ncbi:MAG: PDDEXK nuclease domain-containing protein [Verrucomicrobiota bacterium]